MNQKGYSLIELLIVVAIIGILAAIAIPNLLDAQDRAKQRSTIAELRTWGTAFGSYSIEKGSNPPAQPGNLVTTLKPLMSNYASDNLHDTDYWKHPYYYYTDDTTGNDGYTVCSYGKDGAVTFPVFAPPIVWYDYNGDLVLNDGVFYRLPS